MGFKDVLSATFQFLNVFSKSKIIDTLLALRDQYLKLSDKHALLQKDYEEMNRKYAVLLDEKSKHKVQVVNKTVNQPSSKKPEWEMKGVGNDRKGKKKGRGKKGRAGAGNKAKNRPITKEERATVERCHICGRDLSNQPALKSENVRIIEDIPSLPVEPEVIKVVQEKKYCPHCRKVTTGQCEQALQKSDYGVNTLSMVLYLWVKSCLPYTRISNCLSVFFGLRISTAGLSGMVIRAAKIMKPVYEEILNEVKSSFVLHGDETGWRINGKLWWLWIFANKDVAYYTIDKSRGSDVVKRILGDIFDGVLVVDGWRAYQIIDCIQQSCMAHLLRKIRELYKAFPDLRSVFEFYIKFRRILKDGERLRDDVGISEDIFCRRLEKLHKRMDELLKWRNPNPVLKDIIAKVERQRKRILTFVEFPDVPCHNNFGEYIIRKGVLKRKISYGSKSEKGAEAYAIIQSIYMTCELKGISFIDFVTNSLIHYIRSGKPMLINEYQKRQGTQNPQKRQAAVPNAA